MSKYIDADKLLAEIDKKWKELADKNVKIGGGKYDIEISTYLSIKNLITSLQQEQPKVEVNLREPNVDLSEEIENFCLEYDARKEAWYNMLPKDQKLIYNPTWQNFATNLAYHFYNRGYNAIKEE